MSEPIIVIDHVSMMFNIASEQLNSLKEYFIKLAKRELHFKKFMALEDIDFIVNRAELPESVCGQTIKCIEKNDGTKYFEVGDTVSVAISPDDLMIY